MNESSGVIMFNCGTNMIIRAIVALYSLRKHYDGAVTFYVEDPCPSEFEQVLKSLNCEVVHLKESAKNPLIKKTDLFCNPPYDKTLWIDLDVVVANKIDEMFNALNEVDVCVPHFLGKFTSKVEENLCSNRIKKFQGQIADEFIQEALNNHPAINTGIMSFKKSSQWQKFVEDWLMLANRGVEIKAYIPDEVAFSILYPNINSWGLKIKIMPESYNISVLSDDTFSDPKIYHMHGNKHCVSDLPLANMWKNTFEEMRKGNILNINAFLQYADKRLVKYLGGNSVSLKPAKDETKTPIPIADNKAIMVDENDFASLKTPPSNCPPAKENQTTLRHFFTQDKTTLPIEDIYTGASAFLICNGPSFVTLNHELLRKPGIMTFGINNGPKTFRPNFWTCVDDPNRFLKSIWLDPKITKFIPQSHFSKTIFDNEKWEETNIRVRECPNVIGYVRNEFFNPEIFMSEASLNWGNHAKHGGGRSVMLPALRILFLLGFRKVYLLGCDMKMSETYTYHFDEQRSKGAINCNNSTYDRLKEEYLPQLKPYFDKAGFKVFNCNQLSNLKVFPFISFEEAIQEATKPLGDIPNERVWGMYSKPEEKKLWKQEISPEQKPHLETIKKLEKGENVIVQPRQPKRPPMPPTTPVMPLGMINTPQKPTMPPNPIYRPIPPITLPTANNNIKGVNMPLPTPKDSPNIPLPPPRPPKPDEHSPLGPITPHIAETYSPAKNESISPNLANPPQLDL